MQKKPICKCKVSKWPHSCVNYTCSNKYAKICILVRLDLLWSGQFIAFTVGSFIAFFLYLQKWNFINNCLVCCSKMSTYNILKFEENPQRGRKWPLLQPPFLSLWSYEWSQMCRTKCIPISITTTDLITWCVWEAFSFILS